MHPSGGLLIKADEIKTLCLNKRVRDKGLVFYKRGDLCVVILKLYFSDDGTTTDLENVTPAVIF